MYGIVFYPKWWLDAVGYFTHPGNKDPDAILFSPTAFSTGSITTGTLMLCTAMSAIVFASAGYMLAKKKFERTGYVTIPATGFDL